MQIDVLGPANAPNSVQQRPNDTRIFGIVDTWFKDCTSALLNDGTKLLASFTNGILGQWRALIRANGATANGDDIVTLDNSDDAMALRSMQHLMQRRQQGYGGTASGSANALAVALSPALAEYKAGIPIRFKVAQPNTGPATLNVNGRGAKAILRPDGAQLAARDLVGGAVVEVVYDGAAFQLVAAPAKQLTASVAYYVNAAVGSDGYDGLSATVGAAPIGPFKTVQKAIDSCRLFNLNGFSITIYVAAGTYSESLQCYPINGSGQIALIGDPVTPANVVLNFTSLVGVQCGTNGYSFRGFKAQNVNGYGFAPSGSGTTIYLADMEWGYCLYSHINCTTFAFAYLAGSQRITGAATYHVFCDQSAACGTSGVTVPLTIAAAVLFTGAFIYASRNAVTSVLYSVTGAGNASGPRYIASAGGVISVAGGGANYYPGSSAGQIDGSAYYA